MTDRRVAILLLGCAISGAAIGIELRAADPARTASATEPKAVGAAAFGRQPDRLMATVLARPLFSPTRRPAPHSGPQSFDLSDKRLTGIVITPKNRVAIFAVSGAKPLAVTEGETVNGWEIESINATEIALRGPAGTRALQPKADQSLARQAPPSVAPVRAAPPAAAAAPVDRTGAPPGAQRRAIVDRRR